VLLEDTVRALRRAKGLTDGAGDKFARVREEPRDTPDPRLAVLRCVECGDTFPVHEDEDSVCPTCGGDRHEAAAEPLL
jgi:rubrerythrin